MEGIKNSLEDYFKFKLVTYCMVKTYLACDHQNSCIKNYHGESFKVPRNVILLKILTTKTI
jgi:hypothetical protein